MEVYRWQTPCKIPISDPKLDTTLDYDGKKVTIPQGKPIQQPKWKNSDFSQSEYLIYKESQNRIRYLLKLQMDEWMNELYFLHFMKLWTKTSFTTCPVVHMM